MSEEEIKYEKMIIDIPQNAKEVSVATIATVGYEQVMNTHTYDTKDIKERKYEEREEK